MQPLTVLVLCGCLAVGMVLGLFAALKLEAQRRPDHGSSWPLMAWLNVGLLGLLLLAGLTVDAVSTRKALVGGPLLITIGLLSLWLVPELFSRLASIPLAVAGFGASCLYLAVLPLTPVGIFGESEAAASLLFASVFVALGGVFARPMLDVFTVFLGWRGALSVIGLLCAAPAVLVGFVPADSFPASNSIDVLAVVSEPRLWLATLVLGFYVPLEAFVSVWVTAFLAWESKEEAEGHDQASRWLGWFWVTFLASRVLLGIVQHVSQVGDGLQPVFLVVPALLSAVVLGNLSGSATTRQALSGLITLGLALGPVLPVLLTTLLFTWGEGFKSALGVALFHAGGAMGAAVLSPLVRGSEERGTAQNALRIPLFMALLMTAASLLLALTGRK